MKILLLYPASEKGPMLVLALGMACVAAAAERAGHAVQVVTLRDRSRAARDVAGAVQELSPGVVGVSARNVDDQCRERPDLLLDFIRETVAAVRAATDAPIVLGGAGFSIFPAQALRFCGADYGIAGDGEQAFLALVQCLETGRDPGGMDGLWIPGREPRARAARVLNLDGFPLPLPDRHLPLPAPEARAGTFVPVQSRRGCPLGCAYCSTHLIEGRRLRKRNPALVAANMKEYAAAGCRKFFFVDNTFNLPESYARDLCAAIRDLGVTFRSIVYPGRLSEGLVQEMAAAGCDEVSLGFEHGDSRMLRALRKRFSPEDVRRDVSALRRCGIRSTGFLLLGGPGETLESARAALAFARSLDLDSVKVTAGIRIYPDTPLCRTAEAESGPFADLLPPSFYLQEGLGRGLAEILERYRELCPNWIWP
ncbi:MAG: radical SAM protein [Thermodesulfobacteriota bacterium]